MNLTDKNTVMLRCVIIIVFFVRSTMTTYSHNHHIDGESKVFSDRSYEYVGKIDNSANNGDPMEWRVVNGTFWPSGSKVLYTKMTGLYPKVNVKWDGNTSWGNLQYTIKTSGQVLISKPISVNICSYNNIYTIVKCDQFEIEADTIYIPEGESGYYTFKVQSWFDVGYGDSNYEFKYFKWILPLSSGNSTFYSDGKATLIYGTNDGNNEKVQIIPADHSSLGKPTKLGKPTIITIQRFNGEIKNKTIKSKKIFNWTDLHLENVYVKKYADITLNGYNSVQIVPGFHAELGSTVRIYNGTAPKALTRGAIEDESMIENEMGIDQYSAKLNQNFPSPAYSITTISCVIPKNKVNAYLQLCNMIGMVVMKIPITSAGQNSIDINTSELANGIYMYSLIIDGCLIDTKRMIISN